MKSRLAASVVLSALVLASATGCTFITQQASTIPYSPSDGVSISEESGPLDVRNAMVIADETGELGNLVAGIVNPTGDDLTLNVELEGVDPFQVEVPAHDSVNLGANPVDAPLFIDGLNVKPGATVSIRFQSGDGAGAFAEVPVLDGTLPYYSDLVPVAPIVEPTPIETDLPVVEETPAADDSAEG